MPTRVHNEEGGQLKAAIFWLSMLVAPLCWADTVPDDKLTDEEKQKLLELDKAKMFADKEKDLITSKNELDKAKVDAATPATAAGVTPPTGAVSGANSMTFAMYMVSLESLERVAQAVCKDLNDRKVSEVFVTGKDAVEAAAKDEAATRARNSLKEKLNSAIGEADKITRKLEGKAPPETISRASVAAIASGIDIAAGLVKGAAGFAALFKSERTIQSSDNLLSATEVSASLSMCSVDEKGNGASPPSVKYVDNDVTVLTQKINQISNEVDEVSKRASALDGALAATVTAAAKLDQDIAAAAKAKDRKTMDVLEARRAPPNYDAFKVKASSFVTQAQSYVDTMYQVDATSGLSPLIVTAQFRQLSEAQRAKNRLVMTLLRSNGYSLTTKRLFLNDRVDYAGGVALRASLVGADGNTVYDRVFYRDSGWIRADFDKSGETIKRQNF